MDHNFTAGFDDPMNDPRSVMAEMLQSRRQTFSLPQALYNDARMFRLDMEEIFEKEWIFAGMTCEIPTKGSYITVEVGSNSVIVMRDNTGAVRGFYNVCRHRGSRLCSKAQGKVAKLVCPYHQWTYELDGRLLYAGSNMGDAFDPSEYGLKPVYVKTGGGFILICLAEDPPAVDDFLATLGEYLEPYDMDNVKVAAESTLVEKANWKLVVENNRECYHCSAAHPELLNSLQEFDDTEDPRATPEYKALVARKQAEWSAQNIPWKLQRFGQRNRLTRTPLLEGTVAMTMDGKPACKKLMGRIQNPDMGSLRILHLPNSWNHFMGDHAVVFRVLPLGPQETVVTTKWLVHKDAVEGVDYDLTHMRRVWDATNNQDRRLVEENQLGINSRAYQPGPYSETYEYGVIDFVQWYSEQMLSSLGYGQDHLRVVGK
ncbi:aromatic ring-hydroxylating dioxygenase subunit alpha [Marinobacter sp. M3C]|uniref:aromatic ring-hydroxylating oxygenase subunit alpha n=1 Tax=unclassified Marinobacter TaxID=83889 RepID=UPI00200CCCF5|nr:MULTISPECIES: aromatic ring-hydroxylating dioxygenase subunit alpha [unclassified Marinobacter]UQG56197.1 aromatic ring-hydroxylating dioxygenase subunit alpha [Marinobacter sp. M4C]UQG58811.1 aromatic ring-hydroxylating dioxygenase subunit alpha [Marinobacter sp. M3C]UQG65001.1 aromatic ring-hydroxylating dioxygenase subunit alpha [Marinobacter sp. M2C]UQG69280.1 aromatic ring-hydroxylating dioxygenase subunit alpha [Marinobacter sp. M1C]